MTREELLTQLNAYRPFNKQEAEDKVLMTSWLEQNEDALSRENKFAHFTASAWVVNHDRTKVLMVYHNIYNSWSWLGGHADGEADLKSVAIREVQEESGLQNVIPVSDDIFSIECLTVMGHVKKGAYVSCHLHMNVTYLLEADEEELLRIKPDENSGVAWFTPEEALERSTEPWFVERVYSKLIRKVKKEEQQSAMGDKAV